MLNGLQDKKGFIILKLLILLCLNFIFIMMYRTEEGASYLIALLLTSAIVIIIGIIKAEKRVQYRKLSGAYTIFLVFLFVWMLLILHLQWGDPMLYPSPMRILVLMVEVFPDFLENLKYSFNLFGISFGLSLCTAFPIGLILGSCPHARMSWDPYIKVLSLISPIAYTPYIVGILPTFRLAQIFVVFTGTFWPILKWTVYGVTTLDENYTLTAKLLGMSKIQYYLKVVIPGIMPAVLTGIGASISGGFTVLVAAEIIGSRNGLGFFIKYFADFLNYHKVLTGIIYLGIAVCMITWVYEKIQAYILSWQVNERRKNFAVHRKIRKTQ